jgi:hypothetical protein
VSRTLSESPALFYGKMYIYAETTEICGIIPGVLDTYLKAVDNTFIWVYSIE